MHAWDEATWGREKKHWKEFSWAGNNVGFHNQNGKLCNSQDSEYSTQKDMDSVVWEYLVLKSVLVLSNEVQKQTWKNQTVSK
jgi:hypothetical protein